MSKKKKIIKKIKIRKKIVINKLSEKQINIRKTYSLKKPKIKILPLIQ